MVAIISVICDKMYISPRKDCGFFADRIDKTPLTEVYWLQRAFNYSKGEMYHEMHSAEFFEIRQRERGMPDARTNGV